MDEKLAKSKRIGNHYIPPPARKQGNGLNETSRQKERPVKSSENKSVKLCNDSSLLFKESNDHVKEKPRRSRRSKRTANKADAENAAILCENEVSGPKTTSTASEFIDRIINCQPDTGSDVSVLVDRSAITPGLPLIGLENMSRCHPVFYDAMDGSSLQDDDDDDDDCFKLIKPTQPDHEIMNGYEEVENQLQSMIIAPLDVHGVTELPAKDGNEDVEPGHTIHSIQHDIVDETAKVDDQLTTLSNLCLSNVRANDIPGDNFESPSIEASADEPQYRSPEIQTCSESNGESITIANSNCENDESSASRRAECLKKIDLVVTTEPIQWTETEINSQVISVEDGDWESIYNDQGECLIPSANINSLPSSKNAPNVKPVNKKVDDEEERPHESSSIIEIYGFSEDLKTNDIMTAFGNWIQRGFNLKWVDNTHALGILPTPALAEEVLGSNIPFVKVRPISQGTPLSQERARTLILPSSLRPKTCTALARRLVSGALGLRVNVTPEERAAERELLREAREKKKLVLKQRYAAWEGDFSSLDNSEDKASN